MTEVKTPKEFFENVLPKRFKPDRAEGIDAILQIKITGPKGADWVVALKDQKLVAREGKHNSPTLTLEMAETDFMDLINGELSSEKAFFTGKLRFKGSIALALKLKETGFL